jgi:hypothetical protein
LLGLFSTSTGTPCRPSARIHDHRIPSTSSASQFSEMLRKWLIQKRCLSGCCFLAHTLTGKKDLINPIEARPVHSVFQPSSSHDTNREAYSTSTPQSRSRSRASQTEHTIEKWEVFRDTDVAPIPCVTKHKKELRTTRVMTSPILNYAPKVDGNAVVYSPYSDDCDRPPTKTDSMSGTDMAQLTLQLQDIATTRTSLLRHLDDLQSQEAEVLRLLVQATLPSTAVPTSQSTRQAASPRPLGAPPSLPKQTILSSRKSRSQSPKISRKHVHSRTVSAPSTSSPRSARRVATTICTRIPLSDKTEEASAVAVETTALDINTSPFSATRAHTLEDKLTTQRIPTNSGDDDEHLKSIAEPSYSISTGKARARSSNSSRGRSKSKSGSQSTTRVPRMAAPKAKVTESYEVPETVARKRWEF